MYRTYNPIMRGKMLITVACALGILACGACFIPVPLPPRPHLPPVLSGVGEIAIQVGDETATNLFDPTSMSIATAGNFNRLWKQFPVHADPFSPGQPIGALLKIAVLRKTTSCNPQGPKGRQFCSFEIKASFTLAAPDGRVLQINPEQRSAFGLYIDGESPPPTWNLNPFQQKAAYALAITAGDILLAPANPK